jgi:hypothetical protein
MNGLHDCIIELLHLQKFTKRQQLRENLLMKGYRLTDRELRKTIEVLITEERYCIQSSSKGYSLITTPEDLHTAKSYLKDKALAMLNRAKCLEENYNLSKLSNQLALTL